MPLTPFEPRRHVDRWKKEMDRIFNESIPAAFGFQSEFGTPRMDVFETDSEVVAHFEIAGLERKEDVDIHVQPRTLTISGTIHRSQEKTEDRFHHQERYTGKFHRSISLPVEVLEEGSTASYKNGILEVKMPKVKQEEHRRINVEFH
ncbi:Hsp20/alpha crystallin family protein [Paenibacillus allorhizosphaerae]|uniref:Hsp20/alpha crystallin family protein n=1 Tax=Paenibacillus allorhizosphaerae TaxID=2849866 RepID=A0ABM8VN76_9BACL|nr:Hsp20/alpha crystallin family protein [Paenibacillus allorhizosphaerae]CAG7651009.1 hypothetical protein PAECIP111802_04864 [Paenibacillus allorhizosphaerae]